MRKTKKNGKSDESHTVVDASKADSKAIETAAATAGSSGKKQSSFLRDAAKIAGSSLGTAASQYIAYSFGSAMRSASVTSYTGASYTVDLGAQISPLILPAGIEGRIKGSYTYQAPTALDARDCYGYLYSAQTPVEGGEYMDYYLEKEAPYTKRDQFLAMPFSNADNFMVTGEGVAGGFRLHNEKPGVFRPGKTESSLDVIAVGPSFHTGPTNVGVGGDLGLGSQSLSVGLWDNGQSSEIDADHWFSGMGTPSIDSTFFRFDNDMGGTISYADDDRATKADIVDGGIPVPGFKSHYPNPGSAAGIPLKGNSRVGSSSFIGFHTNERMLDGVVSFGKYGVHRTTYYHSYNCDQHSRGFVDRSTLKDGIGEFAVYSENGTRYVYGLPVYSRREKNLLYGLGGQDPVVHGNYIAYKSIPGPGQAGTVVGEERDQPYASTFLLTEITTSDYVDRTGDGPTPDDFGGYTKFNYRRVAGTYKKDSDSNTWYKWRIPYRGLLYQRNKLSDPRDDMGSVVLGEKEVYYLESIETKTHIAVFVTNKGLTTHGVSFSGSGEERPDGYGAHPDESVATGDENATTASGPNVMERLERIELWSKGADEHPSQHLSTAYFAGASPNRVGQA